MSLSGKSELERFTDKFGYNKIWKAFENGINNYANDFDIDNDFTLYNIDMKFTHNFTVKGCCFE